MIPLRLVNNTGYESDKNLCFFNTALQLLNIQEFREFFKNQEYKNNVNGSFPICEELSNIYLNWCERSACAHTVSVRGQM